jgi:hypothetical protein
MSLVHELLPVVTAASASEAELLASSQVSAVKERSRLRGPRERAAPGAILAMRSFRD